MFSNEHIARNVDRCKTKGCYKSAITRQKVKENIDNMIKCHNFAAKLDHNDAHDPLH